MVLSPYTCLSISSTRNGAKHFSFISYFLLIIEKDLLKCCKQKQEKKIQWLQKTKITVIYIQLIKLDDTALRLFLFHL